MTLKKLVTKHLKWLSLVPVLLALGLSIILASIDSRKQTEAKNYFSPASLQTLRTLNFENEMVVDDLLAEDDSLLMSELFWADATFPSDYFVSENRGLVVSLENDGILLLQPVNPIPDLQLETLAKTYEAAIPEIEDVELDQDVELLGEPFYFWKLDPANEIHLSAEDRTLDPVSIAVIDSGVDTDHEIFVGADLESGWNTFSDERDDMYDDVGHGTHIAGIIISEMPGAVIVPYKIVDSNGGKLSNVIEALNKAIDDEVDVINMSFGLLSPSYSLKNLVEKAYKSGQILVAAAGNNNTSRGFYPATYDHTIAVAAVDREGDKLSKSNYGEWVDLAAFGYRVRSSIPGNKYGYKTGSSQSTALVTARIAEIMTSVGLQNHLTFKEILDTLIAGGTEIEEGDLAGVYIVE